MADIRTGIHGQLLVTGRERPNLYKPGIRVVKNLTPISECPFCPGNEHLTPKELGRIEKDGKWEVRWFPNRWSSLTRKNSAVDGTHQLIIPNPDHSCTYSQLSSENLFDNFLVIRNAVALMQNARAIEYVGVFANEGYLSGQTQEHSHTQILGWDSTPSAVRKLEGFASQKPCGFCRLPNEHEDLVIAHSRDFVAFVPYDSQRYYQVKIVGPHISSVVQMPDALLRALSDFSKQVLLAVNEVTNFAAYNLLIRSAPKDSQNFHFHIDILPYIARLGGFECDSGIVQLAMSPEEMAKDLKRRICNSQDMQTKTDHMKLQLR